MRNDGGRLPNPVLEDKIWLPGNKGLNRSEECQILMEENSFIWRNWLGTSVDLMMRSVAPHRCSHRNYSVPLE